MMKHRRQTGFRRFARPILSGCLFLLAGSLPALPEHGLDNDRVSLSYAFDTENLSIQEVMDGRLSFTESDELELNFGFQASPLWVRIIVQNRSEAEELLYLDIDFPPLDDIAFYETSAESKRVIAHYISGDSHALSARPIRARNHIFPFSLPGNGTRVLYLRVQTTSVLAILPSVVTPDEFRIISSKESLVFGFFYGMVLIMVAYSLGQFFILRDRIFALYAAYIFSLGFFLFVYNGFAFLYLFPESTFLTNHLNPLFLGLSILLALLFSGEYLQLRQTQPFLWKLQTVMSITVGLASLLSFVVPYRIISLSLNLFLLLTLAVLMVSTYRCIRAGNTMAWFYLLSFSGFLVSGIFVVLSNLAISGKSVSTIYSIQAAAALEMVILAIGVSYRYRRLREEKDKLIVANETTSRRLDEINIELDTARRIQMALLPEYPPAIDGLRIVSDYEPSGKLGGDYFDFFEEKNEAGILIADVTGHGTPAALFASLVRYTFQTYRPFMRDPSSLLEWMNRTIYGRLDDHFLTAGYLYINPKIHTIRYGSCGHPALLHLKADGTLQRIKGRGRAMGVIEQTRPETVTATIEKGDRLLLYTDGLEEVIEACSKRDPGIPSELDAFLISRRQHTFQDLIDDLRALVIANRSGPTIIEDDVTWILIEVVQ